MVRFQSVDEVLSALYVDFDNIYLRLLEQDAGIARAFATNPARWMRWIEGHALRMMYGDGIRRRILKRCCYMSPEYYQEYKNCFAKAAFQVYDCATVSSFRKSTADVQLVVDCMDALHHSTRYDEFIILSGDADFTPLLLRFQEHARRSLILSIGHTSPAYAAACTWRIREDWFVTQALEDEGTDESEGGSSGREPSFNREASGREAPNKDQQPGGNANTRRSGNPGKDAQQPAPQPAEDDAAKSSSRAPHSAIGLPASTRAQLIDVIKQLAAESSVPVPLPSIAQVLQCEMDTGPDWYGAGTLGKLLESLDLSPLEFSKTGQGYVFDPEQHKTAKQPGVDSELSWSDPEVYELARKVHARTGAPLLSPEQYASLFSLLAREMAAKGGLKTHVLKRVEESCADEQLPVDQEQIGFVVNTIAGNSPRLKPLNMNSQCDRSNALSEAFQSRVLELCEAAQVKLSTEDKVLMGLWLAADCA